MIRQVVLSKAARSDRREITAYTVERFGLLQARRLRDHFQAVLNTLAKSPWIGRTNAALDPAGYTFRYFVTMKSFVIVYRPTQNGIMVVRILHGARSLAAELVQSTEDEEP